ncbi:MAG: hypothetical protein RLZZ347_739 [Candidatus Parcubacteria bacterium]|jgi:CheY-like chemotaxis protein
MKPFILLVEDDPQQAESIKRAIERHFPQYTVVVVDTEYAFRTRVDELARAASIPRMVVCEVMLPWEYPNPTTPDVPPEVREGTFRKAGTRCWKYFRQKTEFQRVPWIYFTVLDDVTIEFVQHSDLLTSYVQKSGSILPFLKDMGDILLFSGLWNQTEQGIPDQPGASPEMMRILREGELERIRPTNIP